MRESGVVSVTGRAVRGVVTTGSRNCLGLAGIFRPGEEGAMYDLKVKDGWSYSP